LLPKSLQRLAQPFDRAELLGDSIALRGRPENHANRYPRPACRLVRKGHDRLEARPRDVVVDQTFRLRDLDIDDSVLVVDAVGTVHGEPPEASRTDVDLVCRDREACRSPPLSDPVRIDPAAIDPRPRRVEGAPGADLVAGTPGSRRLARFHTLSALSASATTSARRSRLCSHP